MSQYLVTTPRNPEYTGKAYGVFFRDGRALVSDWTIDPSLGWSADEVAEMLRKDFGYEVELIEEDKTNNKKRKKADAAVASEV